MLETTQLFHPSITLSQSKCTLFQRQTAFRNKDCKLLVSLISFSLNETVAYNIKGTFDLNKTATSGFGSQTRFSYYPSPDSKNTKLT